MPTSNIAAAVLTVFLAASAGPAAASPILIFDGNALKEACADGAAYYTYGKCAGYIIGVHDQHVLAAGADAGICFSLEDGNTADGLIDPVVAFLDGHGESLSQPASTLVLAALKEAFPCQ